MLPKHCVLMLIMLLPTVATASARELGVPAEPLQIAEWIKGSPVELSVGKGKHVYVIEFWATWCAPCRRSIPHLTELQRKYKDQGVVVIGISAEPANKVREFVKTAGDKMGYTIACDRAQQTTMAYMRAFGQGGIPHAFVIDKQGRIIWHANPLNPPDGIEQVLDLVLADKFGVDEARALWEKRQAAQSDSRRRMFDQRPPQRERVTPAGRKGNEYLKLLSAGADESELSVARDEFIAAAGRDARLLARFADMLLGKSRLPRRDDAFALKLTTAACAASARKGPPLLELHARALVANGKIDEAIRYQRQAVALTEDEAAKRERMQTLEQYESKRE